VNQIVRLAFFLLPTVKAALTDNFFQLILVNVAIHVELEKSLKLFREFRNVSLANMVVILAQVQKFAQFVIMDLF